MLFSNGHSIMCIHSGVARDIRPGTRNHMRASLNKFTNFKETRKFIYLYIVSFNNFKFVKRRKLFQFKLIILSPFEISF